LFDVTCDMLLILLEWKGEYISLFFVFNVKTAKNK
jgi:hypothetical protein